MPTYIDGLASGMKTNDIIEKLKQVEKQPIATIEKRKQELNLEIEGFTQIITLCRNLEEKVKVLYGYQSSFTSKILTSTPENYVTGEVSKNASENEYLLDIKTLASKLLIVSRPLKQEEIIPSGSISINNKEATFIGGTLSSFQIFLDTNFKDILTSKIINTNNSQILRVESVKEGEDGIFDFKDTNSILKYLELYNDSSSLDGTISNSINNLNDKKDMGIVSTLKEPIPINSNTITTNTPKLIDTGTDANSIHLKPDATATIYISVPVKQNATVKELNLKVEGIIIPKEEDTSPIDLDYGDVQKINIKGIELFTYNIIRHREKDELNINDYDYGVTITSNKGSQNISLKDKQGQVSIPISNDLNSITFYSKNIDANFDDPQFIYDLKESEPKTTKLNNEEIPKLDTGSLTHRNSKEEQMKRFPHLKKAASNAHINLDGVDIEKKTNIGINDLLDGVNLTLLKTSTEPFVVKVENNISTALQQITEFVDAYNELLKFSKENSSSSKVIKKPGEFDSLSKLKGDTGALIGDSTVRALIDTLKAKIANAYPSYREPNFKVLSSIGISTGEVGAKWEDISAGYLQINKVKLEEVLTKYPEAVKEFFASDKNGDLKIDDGFAFQIKNSITPYAQNYGYGLFYSKIQTRKTQIEELKKDVTKIEEKIEKYETKLRQQFGVMETSIKKQKSLGEQIKGRFNNGGDR